MKRLIKFILSAIITTLVLSVFASAASTNTIITRIDGKIKCSVYLEDISKDSIIAVSSFINGRYSASLLRVVTDKSLETFFIDRETNEITVLVFEDITAINPVTKGERIEVKYDSIIDDEWSDWI